MTPCREENAIRVAPSMGPFQIIQATATPASTNDARPDGLMSAHNPQANRRLRRTRAWKKSGTRTR
ncbi:Uncharacterised protein [Mycobacteroides abscessus subsp. abscessus]|nr:Uncharacterised protein [Mycobacteroides abscessus subsp. abscessus]